MNPFDGFSDTKFDILKPRWLPTHATPDGEKLGREKDGRAVKI
jgi:hypothetical protein